MPFVIGEIAGMITQPPEAIVVGAIVGCLLVVVGSCLARIRWWLALLPISLSLHPAWYYFVGIYDSTLHAYVVKECGEWYYLKVRVAFAVPYAFSLTLLGTVCFLFRQGQFRSRHGLCMDCGYDLSATPERCPECGAASVPLRA